MGRLSAEHPREVRRPHLAAIWRRCSEPSALPSWCKHGDLKLSGGLDRGEALVSRVGREACQRICASMAFPVSCSKARRLADGEGGFYGDPLVQPDGRCGSVRCPQAEAGSVAGGGAREKMVGQREWAGRAGRRSIDSRMHAEHSGSIYKSSLLVDHLDHLPEISGTVGPWHWRETALLTPTSDLRAPLSLAVHLLEHSSCPLPGLRLIDFHTC